MGRLVDQLTFTPFDPAYLPEMARVSNAEYEADAVPGRASEGDLRAWLSESSDMFDPARDVTLAFVGDRLVAWSEREWVDTRDGELREYRLDGKVDPRFRRQGIGGAMLHENERRLRQLGASHSTDRPRAFGSWSGDSQAGRMALLRANGYEPVRWFADMTRPTLDDIPDVPLPEGLEVREVRQAEIYSICRADVEAFRDHWGGFDDSDATLERWKKSPSWDPSLWVVAWDGDEVAAGVINAIEEEENRALGVERGWLHSVFTRRPWRRRGLARALIARSLVKIRDRGMTSAVLGVDADNPTGAFGLYESVGFEVSYRSTAWRKPLEPDASER
ncbi:MAG TPA: GNAT family N-acetyltransferase [Candidatus Limnocylindria bacterium]|jgi:mycothiol synthase|nr:GNAT family N-acetyltransferase [Candidatus Limnocylindria bacterium]